MAAARNLGISCGVIIVMASSIGIVSASAINSAQWPYGSSVMRRQWRNEYGDRS